MKTKYQKVMDEYAAGTLKSGSGHLVTSLRQARAIAANVAEKERRKRKKQKRHLAPTKDFFLKIGV